MAPWEVLLGYSSVEDVAVLTQVALNLKKSPFVMATVASVVILASSARVCVENERVFVCVQAAVHVITIKLTTRANCTWVCFCPAGLTVETPHDYDISELIPHRTTCQMLCDAPTPDNRWDNPPYEIHQPGGLRIFEKTLSLTASECLYQHLGSSVGRSAACQHSMTKACIWLLLGSWLE